MLKKRIWEQSQPPKKLQKFIFTHFQLFYSLSSLLQPSLPILVYMVAPLLAIIEIPHPIPEPNLFTFFEIKQIFKMKPTYPTPNAEKNMSKKMGVVSVANKLKEYDKEEEREQSQRAKKLYKMYICTLPTTLSLIFSTLA